MALKQCESSVKRSIHDFFLGFGILLPPLHLCTNKNVEVKKSFADLKTIEPSSFNFFLLPSIGRSKVEWVDVLSCHLKVDERANTIFMFRYPSFCIVCGASEDKEESKRRVIHAGTSPASSLRQWACEEDTTQMLQET